MSDRPNRAPGSVWATRRDPYRGCWVRTLSGDRIEIAEPNGYDRGILRVSRAEARLIARRINECLDATVIR